MINRTILIIAALCFGLSSPASGQIGISGILDLAQTFGDKPDRFDTMFRGDNAFHNIRSKLFITSWLRDDIGVFVEIWHDDQGTASSGGDIRIEGAFIAFMNVKSEALNIKVGKFAHPFGTYYNRTYSNKNPLIGAPFLYSFHTVAQSGTIYEDNAEQIDHKGAMAGNRQFGLPPVYDVCWDAGIAVFANMVRYEYILAVTNATVSSPRAKTNDGKQIAGRIGFRPTFGLKVGASAAYGPYLTSSAAPYSSPNAQFPAGAKVEDFKQTIYAFDLEYSRGYLELFSEYARNSFDSMIKEGELAFRTWYIEGKYKLTPRLYAAVRYDRMIFDEIDNGFGQKETWDYNVWRIEGGFGYKITRDIILKIVQRGYRFKDNPSLDEDTTALQLSVMF